MRRGRYDLALLALTLAALLVGLVCLALERWQGRIDQCPAGTGYVREVDGCVPVTRPWQP